MLSIKCVVLFFLLTASASGVFAQAGVSLSAEIQNIERSITREGISAEERHAGLVRLARFRQLSGDIQGAAATWLEAARAIPGMIDTEALLAGAYCLAAIGEWENARIALAPLLPAFPRARFLDASINAIQTGDTMPLAVLAANPDFSSMKKEIYFMLWKLSSGESANVWRQQLLLEFPQSPEGRLAAGESVSTIVRPSPFWLLAGRQSLTSAAPGVQASPAAAPQAIAQTSVSPPPVPPANAVRLQAGVFSRQANAQSHMANLRQAGFTSSIEHRVVNNNEMWAVIVLAGADTNRTIRELRDAGFEAFPLR